MTDDDRTLPATGGPTQPAEAVDPGERYDLGDVIGRGGMGEVRLARDLRVHREVAIKLMRAPVDDDMTKARFLREARIQGGLEHPAVVPVHDLGIDRDGNPFFVMKRLAGTTLASVLAAPSGPWPRRLLLARFIEVCHAIDFAHARGVVHRDLKPANIMLGDYGETYVLDWGVARVLRATDTFDGVSTLNEGETAAGAILGTPGYMSPEQVRNEDVDERSDVFALGCILYEILSGTPALPRGLAALTVTLQTDHHRPSARGSDVPPELDDLCARATANDRAERPTARELATSVQRYLDGDRDVARRRELATEHANRAAAALRHGDDDDARATAMYEAGRAFVLDPTNPTASATLAKLMLEAPAQIPAEALAAADHERGVMRQRIVRLAGMVFVPFTVLPFGLFVLPVRHAWPIVAMAAICALLALACRFAAREVLPMTSRWFYVLLVLDLLLLVSTGVIFGPLFVLPVFVIGSLGAFLTQPHAHGAMIIAISHVLAIVPLVVLEALHVTPRTFAFVDGGLLLRPWAIDLDPLPAAVILAASFAAQFFNTLFLSFSTLQIREAVQNRVHAQSWHLRKLLPPA